MSRASLWLLPFAISLSVSIMASPFAQTTGQKQTAGKTTPPATTNKADAATDVSSRASSSPGALVGTIVKIRMNGAPQAGAGPMFVEPGTRVRIQMNGAPLEGIVGEDCYLLVHELQIPRLPDTRPKLSMAVRGKSYTVSLRDYRDQSLSIEGGATIRVTGKIVGNTIYATKFETVKNPPDDKTFIPTDVKIQCVPSPTP